MTPNQEQLLAAEVGLNKLMDDDLDGARSTLQSQHNSPYALAGLGICDFLAAAVGMEDDRLSASMEALALAEKSARKHKHSNSIEEPGQWWTQAGMEYEVLIADLAAAQALLHILGESYVEYMKAMWKLNSAFKHFTTIYKAVFPKEITSTASVSSIIADLNHRYESTLLSHAMQQASLKEATNTKSGWGFRLRGPSMPAKIHSAVDLPGLSKSSKSKVASVNGTGSIASGSTSAAASLPNSAGSSTRVITPPSDLENASNEIVSNSIPKPAWTESPVTSFVVSGGAFGHAIFELVFALMPPKARKMFSWLGYGSGDRKKALKLLEVAALTGTDVHGSFASLALVSYYTSILVSSGWQSDRRYLINACHAVSDRALEKHPHGKLWLVNKAKLLRLEGQVNEARAQLREGLAAPSNFRQATSTLQYELCWVDLSLRRYSEASEGFLAMIELNSWSHTTYYALAAACLHEIQDRTPKEEKRMRQLYERIPAGFNRKRFMGQPPSSEVYLEKRIRFYKAKTERWIGEGRLSKDAEWFDSVTISMALELSLFWNQFAHYPRESLDVLVKRLEGYLTAEPAVLDTPEETELCETILGACYVTLQDYATARRYLSQTENATATLDEAYNYLDALSRLYGAIAECQEAEDRSEVKAGKEIDKSHWSRVFAEAESKLDALFTHHSYDMQGRVEGRAQMLRVEISERKTALGIV